MQSIHVQHRSHNVIVYYEVQSGRAVFWTTSVPLAPDQDYPMCGALAGEHVRAETQLDSLIASVRSAIDWLESRILTARTG